MGMKIFRAEQTSDGLVVDADGIEQNNTFVLPHFIDHDSLYLTVDGRECIDGIDLQIFDTDKGTSVEVHPDFAFPASVTATYAVKGAPLSLEQRIDLVKNAFSLRDEDMVEILNANKED